MTNRLWAILIMVCTCIPSLAQAPQGFYLDDWQPKTITRPSYQRWEQPSGPASVTVTVDLADTLSKVSRYVYGNNGVTWAGKMNQNTGLMQHIENLQPHVLRWPGGNLSQEYFWDRDEFSPPADIPPEMGINPIRAGRNTTNWAMTLSDYYDMLEKTGSTGCICINYSYARYGLSADPVARAAHYAAEWVRYDDGRTRLWELGNENMGPWEAGYEIDTSLNQDGQPPIISGALYGQHARVFIDSMKYAAAEIGSEIRIGVVVQNEPAPWNQVMESWNSTMLPEIADKADFLILHSYFTPYDENSTVSTILHSPPKLKTIRDFALNHLAIYAGMENLPLALTEWNIFAQNSMQRVSYINGMHATLVLGELIRNRFGQANRWDLMNGWAAGDDHGLFARADEPGMVYGEPHAPFYYMYYFQKYFGDHMVRSTVEGSNNVVSYASAFSSGQSGVVLVNKGIFQEVVNLQMANMEELNSYYRYVLQGGSDNGAFSRQVYVNGHGPALAGGGPADYETLAAMGTPVDGEILVELPPLSVTHILVTGDTIASGTGIREEPSFSVTIHPNPATGALHVETDRADRYALKIHGLQGQQVYGSELLGNRFTVDISGWPEGVYILSLSSGNETLRRRFVRQ